MFRLKRTLPLLPAVAFIALTLAAAPSFAVVGGITSLLEFSDPASLYYGLNPSYVYETGGGTSVSIGYFTLLTARHYSTAVGSTFEAANGDVFRVTSTTGLVADTGQAYPPDLRVVHVENTTNKYRPLPGFYDLYTSSSYDTNLVIVGTGDTGGTFKDYYTDTLNTRDFRWGTNQYKEPVLKPYNSNNSNYRTWCFTMSYGPAGATAHESGIGDGDSGGGVFIKYQDPITHISTWQLAGISLYKENYGTASDKFKGAYAARICDYATRIQDILDSHPLSSDLWRANMLPGDLDGDGKVTLDDYITLKAKFGDHVTAWTQGDFNGDGLLGFDELLAIQANVGYDLAAAMLPIGGTLPAGGPGMAVPEPTTLLLLAAGAVGLTARRRRRLVGSR